MSDYIDTRNGWRTVDVSDPNSAVYNLAEYDNEGVLVRGWVRVKPVAPLPVQPYTVIRVTWLDGGAEQPVILRENNGWHTMTGYRIDVSPDTITSFKVLAESVSDAS